MLLAVMVHFAIIWILGGSRKKEDSLFHAIWQNDIRFLDRRSQEHLSFRSNGLVPLLCEKGMKIPLVFHCHIASQIPGPHSVLTHFFFPPPYNKDYPSGALTSLCWLDGDWERAATCTVGKLWLGGRGVQIATNGLTELMAEFKGTVAGCQVSILYSWFAWVLLFYFVFKSWNARVRPALHHGFDTS